MQAAPSVATIYVYEAGGTTISTTGSIAHKAAPDLDVYAQLEGEPGTIGSVQTGIAVVNPTGETLDVQYELVRLDGTSSGVSGKFAISPKGQKLTFVNELPGASNLPLSFRGVLRLTSARPISALGIHGRYNERGEFLMSTTPPMDSTAITQSSAFIPQVVDGGGYSTEIVIYDVVGSPLSGNIYFFDQNGQPIDADLVQATDLSLP